MKGLLVVERYILEIIGNCEKTFEELQNESQLPTKLLKSILNNLNKREILSLKENFIFLNKKNKKHILKEINSKEMVKEELKELFNSFLNEYFEKEAEKASLNVKKVKLDKFEYLVLQSHFKNLKDFFSNLSLNCEKEVYSDNVILWGECDYRNLVKGSLAC